MASHSRRSPSVLDISVAPNAWTIPVKHAELQEVLKSAANQILQHVDGRIGTIRVNKRQDGNLPITRCAKGERGEWTVDLVVENNLYWSQFALQFAHEVAHIILQTMTRCVGGILYPSKNMWLEEAICEAASLFALRSMSEAWLTPPRGYSLWIGFAPEHRKYADDRMAGLHRALPGGTTVAAWVRANITRLRAQQALTPDSELLANYLIPLFERTPSGWDAIRFLNASPGSANMELDEYLGRWLSACPPNHHSFVHEVSALLAITPTSLPRTSAP